MVITVSLAILQLGGRPQGVLRLAADTCAKAWGVPAAFGEAGVAWQTLGPATVHIDGANVQWVRKRTLVMQWKAKPLGR